MLPDVPLLVLDGHRSIETTERYIGSLAGRDRRIKGARPAGALRKSHPPMKRFANSVSRTAGEYGQREKTRPDDARQIS
jgi:hypothetical protein